jgi:hypothetical protein
MTAPRPRPEFLALLDAAMGSRIGLLLRTNDPARLRQSIHKARQLSGDPQYALLQIRTSPFEGGQIVVVKGGVRAVAGPAVQLPSEEDLGELLFGGQDSD